MIVKGNLLKVNRISSAIAGFILVLSACDSPSDILNSTDTQNVNSEAVSSVYTNESSDLSSDLIASLTFSQYAGARTESETISSKDDRIKCATITLTRTGTKLSPKGTILVDFGSGCTDARGVTRKGQIYIKYSGRRWTSNAYIKDSLVNYYHNNTHIEGVLTMTVSLQVSADTSSIQFQHELVGGKITFADGKTITRTHTITRKWVRATLPINNQWITLAGSSAGGVTKKGVEYQMVVTKDMVEKTACLSSKVFIPVSGEKIISTENKQYSINYGDGNCDNEVIVTLNGKTKTISVSDDGN
jgi:hypothetical protein